MGISHTMSVWKTTILESGGTKSVRLGFQILAIYAMEKRAVDIAFECTGIFTDSEKASAHLQAGAKRVLVSAPSKGADKTIVFGVNHKTLTKDDLVVSNAVLHHQLSLSSCQSTSRHNWH